MLRLTRKTAVDSLSAHVSLVLADWPKDLRVCSDLWAVHLEDMGELGEEKKNVVSV